MNCSTRIMAGLLLAALTGCTSHHFISKANLIVQTPKEGEVYRLDKVGMLGLQDENGNTDTVVIDRNTQLICHMQGGNTKQIYFATGRISDDTIFGYRSKILRIRRAIPVSEIDQVELYSEFKSSRMKRGISKNRISVELLGRGMLGFYYDRSLLKHASMGIGTSLVPSAENIETGGRQGELSATCYLTLTTPDFSGNRLFAEPGVIHNFVGVLPNGNATDAIVCLGYSYVAMRTGVEYRVETVLNYYDFPGFGFSFGYNF